MPSERTVPALLLLLLGFCPIPGTAQSTSELLTRMSAMEERIKQIEGELSELKNQQAATTAAITAAAPANAPAASQGQAPVQTAATAEAGVQVPPVLGGAGGAAAKVLNPDIAVIGDFLGAAGYGGNRATPSFEMHESEVAFQAILDPYARADFFFSFGEQGVNLEEGYVTFPALPGHLQLRAGKMRAAFGKVNTLHNHVLPWTDRPLVTQDLVGGEDGINDAGLSLTRVFAGPKDTFLEATAQIFRGDSDELFRSYRRSDVSAVGHFRAYRDITESTNVDIGVSYAHGHSILAPDVIDQLWGIDTTVRWKPLRRAIYHSLLGRSEFIWSRYRFPGAHTTPFGYYISTDYQFARRWFLGGRFDRTDRLDNLYAGSPGFFASPGNLLLNKDTGASLVLTYWPSEFSQIRGQLRRTQYGENMTANEFLFQFQFSIGAHGAHPF